MKKFIHAILLTLITIILLAGSAAPLQSGNGAPSGLFSDNRNEVMEAPYFQDFNSVSTPDLPAGWHKIVDNPDYAQATVGTSTAFSPHSPPNHARLLSNNYPDQDVILITPAAANFANKRIRFYAKCNLSSNVPDLIIGTMSDPTDAGTFVPFHTLSGADDITNSYQQFVIELDSRMENNTHLAFRHGGTPSTGNRNLFIDNFAFEEVPDGPVLTVMPSSWDFGEVMPGSTSNFRTFIIQNAGIGTLTISPDDIGITGPDADRFNLFNITTTVHLEEFETTVVNVSFSPQNVGNKEATLEVDNYHVPLTGEGFDPTITEVPHIEDFSGASPPDLAIGWSKIVLTGSTGGIETISTGGPNSPPNHVRFQNMIDVDANLLLITPEIDLDLSTLRVRFFSKALSGDGNAIEVGTISNPANIATYTPLQSFDITTSYQEFTYSFVDYTGDDSYIVFKALFPAMIRTLYFDDFVLEAIPELPILNVSPVSHDFGQIQTGENSNPQDFTISNQGEGLLVIGPDDIELTGTHAEHFLLNNLSETVELAGGESAVVSVVFAPTEEGLKTAQLEVMDFVIDIQGEGIDATITEFPWIEDFSGVPSGTIPFGWIRDATNWRVANTDGAGGEAPEMRFMWSPVVDGAYYLKTPLIHSSGHSELMFSFKHYVNNFADPGPYTLRLISIVQDQEYLIHEWIDPSNIPAEEYWTVITEDHGVGSDELRLAFVFDGNSSGIRDWHIDDVALEEVPDFYQVGFFVGEDSPDQLPLEGATIVFDTYVSDLVTNEEGLAAIDLPDGAYSAAITKAGYEPQEISFVIDGEDKDLVVLMQDVIELPYNLEVVITDNTTGEALFSWDHDGGNDARVLTGFNVFLDDMEEPVATTETNEYLFTGLQTGDYTAGVQAVYTTGLSDIVSLDFFIEVIAVPTFQLPWAEDFTGTATGELPEGWTATAENWGVSNTSNAGGAAPEMRFYFLPEAEGVFTLKSPYLDTEGFDEIFVSFKNLVNNFSTPGIYTLKLVVLVGENEYLVHEWVDPDDIPPHTFSAILTANDHGIGDEEAIQLAWIFEGSSGDINWWSFDDVFAGEIPELFAATFEVVNQFGHAIDNAFLYFNGVEKGAGVYVVEELAPGSHHYVFSKDGHANATGSIEITDQDITEQVVMQADVFQVTFHVEDEAGNILDDASITFDGHTYSSGEYVIEEVLPGTYAYTVSLQGFFDHSDTVVVEDEDLTVQVVLEKDETSIVIPGDVPAVTLYPNPATNHVIIEAGEVIQTVRILDMLGQPVHTATVNRQSYELSLSGLRAGTYFVNVTVREEIIILRLNVTK